MGVLFKCLEVIIQMNDNYHIDKNSKLFKKFLQAKQGKGEQSMIKGKDKDKEKCRENVNVNGNVNEKDEVVMFIESVNDSGPVVEYQRGIINVVIDEN